MNQVLWEIAVILVLLIGNGVFSMAEIAVVSARKPRLRHQAEGGDARARRALALAESPNTFLSTVQIGITLVGVLAAAFSGATLAAKLAEPMKQAAWLAPYADRASFAVVVGALTYLTLVIGELLPKRLGLAHSEGIARALAGPMMALSRLAAPLVALLSASTDALLKAFRLKPGRETTVSEEEVKLLVKEGTRAGVFLKHESEMVESVLALDRLPVRDLMTPRAKIIWVNVADAHDTLWHKVVVSAHTTFPVYEGNRDRVVGFINVKSIYAHLAAGLPVKVRDLITPPLVVPALQTAGALLETFRRGRHHVALVADEFGGITGLVSLHDVMEAIVGDLPSQGEKSRPAAVRRDDGSWLVDGMLDIESFARALPQLQLPPAEARDYQTVAGFVLKQFGHVPTEGESFSCCGYLVEVIDMDGHRVDKLLLMPSTPTEGAKSQ